MSIQYAEGDLYIGYSGSDITSLSGSSGVAIGDVLLRAVAFSAPRSVRLFRRGPKPDDIEAWSLGGAASAPVVTVNPVGTATTEMLRLVLARLYSGAVNRSDTDTGLAPTIQIAVRPVSGSLDVAFYAPAAVLISDVQWTFGRGQTPLENVTIQFACQTASAGATTPAQAFGTVAQLNTLYGF